jgi:hypothetical protein
MSLLNTNNLFNKLLLASVLLFLLLFTFLSFHSRITGDDYFYLWLTNTFGAWDGMIYQYKAWSGRWSAHFLGCLFIPLWKYSFFLPFIHLLSIFLLLISLKEAFQKISKALNISPGKKELFVYALLLIASFYFLSYRIGETWFWYIIIITYLWSLIAFIFLMNAILSEGNSFSKYLIIVFTSLFIGGASESYAMIFITIVSFLFALSIYSKAGIIRRNHPALLTALIVLIISFFIAYLAPGTEIRHSLLPQTSVIEKVIVLEKSIVKYFIRYLPSNVIVIFLFSAPWFYFGRIYMKDKFERKTIVRFLKTSSLVFIVLLLIMFVPTALVMSEIGPGRALSIVSFFTALYFAVFFATAGSLTGIKNNVQNFILLTTSIWSIVFLSYSFAKEYQSASLFATSCDERIRTIETAVDNNFEGILVLPKIAPAGMLFWDELSTDTNYYTNQHLKKGLNLNFHVSLKSE